MPRESLHNDGPYVVQVGWGPHDGSVQIAVSVEGDQSIFWELFSGDDQKAELGKEIRAIPMHEFPDVGDGGDNELLGERVLNILDTVSHGGYKGIWSHLNSREDCNRLIRLTRRARDSVFGRDE